MIPHIYTLPLSSLIPDSTFCCNIPDQSTCQTTDKKTQNKSLQSYVFRVHMLSLPELLWGPEALETAADSNWWYTLHQRAAATPWCALAGLLLPARQIWRAPTHLLLTPKAASAICSTPEHCRYLLMFDEHGHTAPWRTISAVFHVLVH